MTAHNTPVSAPSGLSAGLEGQDATQETQDATEAAQRRVERYAEEIRDALHNGWMTLPKQVFDLVIDAAIAVADEELAELEGILNHDRDAACASLRGERVATSWHLTRRAEAAEAKLAEMREEWTVRHAQGIHPGPFTEAAAREWIANDIKRDPRRKPHAQCRQALLRRYVTDWDEVILDAPKDTTAP